uniref:PH domain-containing protein n=1 Tax=Scylla olivacea TaxID=85551 RepID=A0A0P4VZF0_SCYOL
MDRNLTYVYQYHHQQHEVTRTNSDSSLHCSHNRQETTLVHPVTHKTALQAEAIPPPPPAATQRCEASSAAPVSSGLNNHEPRKGAGRRRGGSWVKTPGARRPEVAPVTLQGWLYKQGADGLHLWKKRWFVLSEYCLYYYKGPDEDKVLGSLPLPSFKISPVDSEDRVYRRHAFKAEHQNTRTYYFAAETKEQMTHWMNALSLASILQKDTSIEEKLSSGSSARRSERPSVSSLASTASPSADESDSGFHGYRSRRYRSPDGRSLDEASESSRLQGDRLNTSCDSSVILRPGDRQPLYANAPPKPKRLNSSRDYSTSPERSPERDERDPRTYTDHGGGGSGGGCGSGLETRGVHYHPPSAERRTPDAYGVTAGGGRGDYEDVYGDSNGSNSTPHSPIRRGDQRDSYASSRSGGTRLSEELQLSEPLRSKFCRQEDTLPRDSHHRHCPSGPPRPHSADFLEYDRRHGKSEMWSYRRGSGGDLIGPNDTRPKSSVGQNESDHWSEENYAQKMRQSSLYHSHMHSRSALRYSPAGPPENPIIDHHHLHSNHSSGSQRVPPAGAATPDLYTPHKQTLAPTTMNATNSLRRGIGQETPEMSKPDIGMDPRADLKPYPRHAPRQTPPQQDLKPELRHNHRPDPSLDLRRTYNYEDAAQKHDVSPNTTLNSVPTPPGSYPSSASPNGSVNNNFMRSASARLPRQRLQDDVINTSLPDDTSDGDTRKIQQREESMKRLLEWKQRMLQSPLTRKPNARPDGTTTPQPRTNHEAYRQQVLSELANQEARTKVLQSHSHSQSYATSQETHPVPHTGTLAGQSFEYTSSLGTSQGQAPCQNNWTPGIQNANTGHMQHGDSNPGGMYFPPGMPSERPAPQGGSSQTGSDSGSSKRREGRRDASRTRHMSGDARRSTSASRYNSYSSDEDDVKLGESLPRRLETNPTSSSGTQGSGHTHTHLHAHHQNYQHHSHAHHQNYQHHPHPHSQNQYHHYKSDDLHKYHHYQGQNYQSNGPSYSNYHGGHGYHQNYQENPSSYTNNYKHAQNRAATNYQEGQQPHQTTVIADYNTLSSQHSSGRGNGTYRSGHYDFQDYHNYKNHQQDYKHHQQEYKHQQDYKHHQQDYKHHQQEYKQHPEYATYDKHLRPHDQRLNGRLHGDLHQQQQFSDSELTVSKVSEMCVRVSVPPRCVGFWSSVGC